MGTRNLTKVINANGEVVVAQYGQWDGYPSGQGATALFHATHNLDRIREGIKKVYWMSDAEAEGIYQTLPQMNYLGTDDSKNFGLLYPNLTRDTCAEILGVIAYSVGKVGLIDNSDFENDELFCEGVYTIDFQNNKFISNYGKVVEFDLDNLPTLDKYLEAFRE